MFTISFLQTNGSRKGRRLAIATSPTVVGRADNSDITLRSRSVSRKHCVVIFNETDVLLRDLGSRNGTFVNQQKLTEGITLSLCHHDEIRIGKYSFRVSIRDRETRRPHDPKRVDNSTVSGPAIFPSDQHKGSTQLLSELDDLAAQLGTFHLTNMDDDSQTDVEEQGNSDSENESGIDTTIRLTKKSSSQPEPKINESEEQSSEIEAGEDDETDAKKLPPHLRPKGPKDSQSAAETALRNLFTK